MGREVAPEVVFERDGIRVVRLGKTSDMNIDRFAAERVTGIDAMGVAVWVSCDDNPKYREWLVDQVGALAQRLKAAEAKLLELQR